MAQIITPTSQVSIGGNNVKFLSWQITSGESALEHNFSIKVEPSVNVSIDDEVIITSQIGGANHKILSDGKVEKIGKELGNNGVILTITGRDKASRVLRLAPVKNIYFIDKFYLNQLCGGEDKWILINGIIKWRNSLNPSNSKARVILGGLPNEDIKDDEIEIHIGKWTSHTIAKFLAEKIGLSFECNAPSYYMDDLYVAPKDSSYWRSIINLFSIYNLNFFVRNDKIQAYDIDLYKHNPSMSLSNKTTIIKDRVEVQMSGEKINDLKIIGKQKPPCVSNNQVYWEYFQDSDNPPGADELNEEEQEEIGIDYIEYDYVINLYSQFPNTVIDDTSIFSTDELDLDLLSLATTESPLYVYFQNHENQVLSTIRVHVWMFAHGKNLYVRKQIEDHYIIKFDDLGNPGNEEWISKKTTKYKYDDHFRPKKIVEVNKRGPLTVGNIYYNNNFDYLITTKRFNYIQAWNVVNTTEVQEGYVVYDAGVEENEGKKYNPRVLNDTIASGVLESGEDSIQNMTWCLIKITMVTHDTFQTKFLEKRTVIGDYLNDVISMEKEIIPLSEKEASKQEEDTSNEPSIGVNYYKDPRIQHYTWRYSDYTDENDHYPMVVLSNQYFVPDAVAPYLWAGKPHYMKCPTNYGDDDLPSKQADYIWEKVQKKKSTHQIRLNVISNVPLPMIEKGQVIELPDKDYQQYNFSTKSWVSVGLSTTSYWVISYNHSCSITEEGVQWITELGLSNVMIG